MSSSIQTIVRIVADAIEGKYAEANNALIEQEVGIAWTRLSNVGSLDELLDVRRKVHTLSDDINNQVATLMAIRKFCDAPAFYNAPMTLLHRIAFGVEPAESRRQGACVAGYPGRVPTEVSEASVRFEELERLVEVISLAPVGSANLAAPLLAHVFAATIRIHPFEDGNGRVARFTVQFLLTRWGMDLLPLPKVRNDLEWKRALRSAVRGELGELIDQIRNRLEQRRCA